MKTDDQKPLSNPLYFPPKQKTRQTIKTLLKKGKEQRALFVLAEILRRPYS